MSAERVSIQITRARASASAPAKRWGSVRTRIGQSFRPATATGHVSATQEEHAVSWLSHVSCVAALSLSTCRDLCTCTIVVGHVYLPQMRDRGPMCCLFDVSMKYCTGFTVLVVAETANIADSAVAHDTDHSLSHLYNSVQSPRGGCCCRHVRHISEPFCRGAKPTPSGHRRPAAGATAARARHCSRICAAP